jgi:hypothetical protein
MCLSLYHEVTITFFGSLLLNINDDGNRSEQGHYLLDFLYLVCC